MRRTAKNKVQREPGGLLFPVAEAAEILGVKRQTLYAAIDKGTMRYVGEGYGKKVRVQDVILHGLHAGKDMSKVLKAIYQRGICLWEYEDSRQSSYNMLLGCGPDRLWGDILYWFLDALGIVWLVRRLPQKEPLTTIPTQGG